MTLREVQWRLDGETERENRAFERLAQLACWVINPWIEKAEHKMHVSKLLTRRAVGQAHDTDWDEWAAD